MLERIIEKFCINSKFVNDFDGLYEFLEGLEIGLEEKNLLLEQIFSYNSSMYSIIVEENKKLEKIIAQTNVTKERKELPSLLDEEEIKEKLNIINYDVHLELSKIKACENLEELKYIVSNKASINNFIILKLMEEIYDIKKMLYQERRNLDVDTKIFFENEMQKLKIKADYLKQIANKDIKNNVDINNELGNKMIFLKTNYGNACVYSDIKNIPSESYDLFYDLLESIRKGTFKNIKVLSGDGPLKGLTEVKDDQARVVYDCTGNNTFIILAMFIKKVDTDAGYRAYLVNRKELYEHSREMIVESQTNESYLEENIKIREKVYSILKKDEKIKTRGGMNG